MIINPTLNLGISRISLGKSKLKFKNIKRFQNVDNTLYRGSEPDKDDIKVLKSIGINTIIDFTTGLHAKHGCSEKESANKAGINYINLPFYAYRNPPEEYVDKFFEIMENARKNNEKVYIHCREGKDRTGLFCAMYEIKYNGFGLQQAIQEMLDMGHDCIGFPNLIQYLKKFYYNTQPNLNFQPSNTLNKNAIYTDNKKKDKFNFLITLFKL